NRKPMGRPPAFRYQSAAKLFGLVEPGRRGRPLTRTDQVNRDLLRAVAEGKRIQLKKGVKATIVGGLREFIRRENPRWSLYRVDTEAKRLASRVSAATCA